MKGEDLPRGVREFPGLSSFPPGLSHTCPRYSQQPSQSPCTLPILKLLGPQPLPPQNPDRGLPSPISISSPSPTPPTPPCIQLSEAPLMPASTPMEAPSRSQREKDRDMVSLQSNRQLLAPEDREEMGFSSQGPAHTVSDWPKIATEFW